MANQNALDTLLCELGLRTIARDVLAETSRIQRVAIGTATGDAGNRDGADEIVLAWQVEQGEDEAALTRALAAAAWVRARLPDWLQLAPQLGIRSQSPIRSLLLATGFTRDAIAAARELGRNTIELIQVADERPTEPASAPDSRSRSAQVANQPMNPALADQTADEAPLRSRFRTGLSDEDLRIAARRGGS